VHGSLVTTGTFVDVVTHVSGEVHLDRPPQPVTSQVVSIRPTRGTRAAVARAPTAT